jgi:Flp pilus assembly protein TadG
MKPAILLARARRSIRRFLRDKQGVSAVEFAMLLPLMVALYLGGVEVSSAIAIDRKVTLVARTLGDLVAQTTSVTSTDVSNILGASASIVQPYDDSKLKITVSDVKIDSQGNAKIAWSDTKNGTARTVGSTVTLPTALNTASTHLVWAEVQYAYTPAVGYIITGTRNLTDQIYMRPRLSDCVLRQGVTTTC